MILISLLGFGILYNFLPFKLRAACQIPNVSFVIDVYTRYTEFLQHLVLKLEKLECYLEINHI